MKDLADIVGSFKMVYCNCLASNGFLMYFLLYYICQINLNFGGVIDMRCALAAMGFINEDITFNKRIIMDTMIKYSGEADIVIFGEAFLQGFYGATFDVDHDQKLAISQDDLIIQEICLAAKEYAVAVSFGFIEKTDDAFYSSQMTIDYDGKIIDVYRRVSPGWKESFASEQYREGNGFHTFNLMARRIVVGLCGDLWFDENVNQVKALLPDIVFWPVYTDFNANEWNQRIKHEYAMQAGKICKKVLYVNSLCIDMEGDEIARGGAVLFVDGRIEKEIPSGKADVLIVEI